MFLTDIKRQARIFVQFAPFYRHILLSFQLQPNKLRWNFEISMEEAQSLRDELIEAILNVEDKLERDAIKEADEA